MKNYRHSGACLKAHPLFPQENQEASRLKGPGPPSGGWGGVVFEHTCFSLQIFFWQSERAEPIANETVFSICIFPLRCCLSLGLGVWEGIRSPGTQDLPPDFLTG